MKNKEFYKLLKRNNFKSHSNSGFTLTELLVGLFLSIFVVGALGFGLMRVLTLTKEEGSLTQARSETTRAMDFLTDEIRSARAIEDDFTNATRFVDDTTLDTDSDVTVVIALDIPEPEVAGDRVVYYLKEDDGSNNLGNWEGPQVLYRYGPPLNADGTYGAGGWQPEALIDKIDNTTLSSDTCGAGQILTPAIANATSGFYACIDDADGDGIGISAQIYFSGSVDTAAGDNKSNYSTNTQVVARARTPEENNPGLDAASPVFFRSLGAVYGCNPSDNSSWTMRTDFANNVDNPNNSTKWIYREGQNRRPQPLKITNKKLEITSVPIDPLKPVDPDNPDADRTATTCLNDVGTSRVRGNRNLAESDPLYEKDADGNLVATENNLHTVKHTVDFDDPTTFNGNLITSTDSDGNHTYRNDKYVKYQEDNPSVTDKRVIFLKNDTVLSENFLTRGYDPDDNDANGNEQISLGEFLLGQPEVFARKEGENYIIQNLASDERIVAFEIGWEDPSQPGFDLQDNVFLMKSNLLAKEYESE